MADNDGVALTSADLMALLLQSRKVLTDGAGWQDDEATVAVVEMIDEAFGGDIPAAGRGAYDEEEEVTND